MLTRWAEGWAGRYRCRVQNVVCLASMHARSIERRAQGMHEHTPAGTAAWHSLPFCQNLA
eukprot:356692-Chlamydomonas_euryale.AAC.6